MAQKIETRFVDDLDGSEAIGTTEFMLDGRTYEVDLSEANRQRLDAALAEFIAAGRRAPRGARAGARSAGHGATAKPGTDRERTAAIRRWAQDNGFVVAERGRVPKNVIEAYEKVSA